jgi:hypothetical protein
MLRTVGVLLSMCMLSMCHGDTKTTQITVVFKLCVFKLCD